MARKKIAAQNKYADAVNELKDFCEDNTELDVTILDKEYPFRVQFRPSAQINFFGNENVNDDGDINDLTVTVGINTAVKSTLRFKMGANLLKKLIKMAEKVGELYYHAYRERADVDQEGEEQ